jgi:hypothetical protein
VSCGFFDDAVNELELSTPCRKLAIPAADAIYRIFPLIDLNPELRVRV